MARKPVEDGDGLGGFGGLSFDAAQSKAPQDAPTVPRASRAKTPADTGESVTEPPERAKWGEGRTRNTRSFSITDELFERLRRYTAAKGVDRSSVVEVALTRAMDRAEEANGGPFPPVPKRERPKLDDL